MQSLAIKYRPQKFTEVVEQSATKVILQQQLSTGEIKNAYLFCGSAGTGKTTCARIFANEINKGQGSPIELDAASNNSVDDIREIIQQSKTASLDSEYKIFILDEVHALSNSAWQAMLKVLEEPPAKSIFIMCTTDPNRVPKTILSRVQRYNFQRISTRAILERLEYVVKSEFDNGYQIRVREGVLDYIAKLSNGGMRDALTLLDKCLAYSDDLTLADVVNAVGITEYSVMCDFLRAYEEDNKEKKIAIINDIYQDGKDLKLFIKDLASFVLEICKWYLGVDEKYLNVPLSVEITAFLDKIEINAEELLTSLIKLQNDIKWDTNPKSRIEAWCITKE